MQLSSRQDVWMCVSVCDNKDKCDNNQKNIPKFDRKQCSAGPDWPIGRSGQTPVRPIGQGDPLSPYMQMLFVGRISRQNILSKGRNVNKFAFSEVAFILLHVNVNVFTKIGNGHGQWITLGAFSTLVFRQQQVRTQSTFPDQIRHSQSKCLRHHKN